jgi:Fic family protein
LFQNKTIKNKTLIEQLEAKNHQSALIFLFNYLKKNENNPINEELVLKLHSILMN